MREFRMLIDGKAVAGAATMEVIDPATEEPICHCPRADAVQLEAALQAAVRAFPAWRDTPHAARVAALTALAERIEHHADEIAHLLTLEQGKPLAAAKMEVSYAPAMIRYFAGLDFSPEVVQDDEALRVEVHRRPLGVVAGIVPWNFPFLMAVYKLAPAILVGNSFVLKPAPTTPLTALLLGDLARELVPAGVVNVIADGGDLGPLLSAHPAVAKVSFTGSTAVGKAVMASGADTVKRLTLELGGNDAAIVLDDVDVEAAAAKLFNLAFVNSGQVCMAIKRIYVQAPIYDAMCEALARLATAARVGNGLDPDTELGPVQNRRQYERIATVLAEAPRHGRVIAGGRLRPGPGFFVEPTVVRDIREGNPLVDEEVFGPVRSVLKFDTVDEAVERANRSPYGLGGSVWTADPRRGAEIAARLECGTAWVNQHFNFGPHLPFGGRKESGLGVEFSREGVLGYTDVQVLSIAKQ